MTRKIIQISVSHVGEYYSREIIALCDDGTIWRWSDVDWHLIKYNDIPQTTCDVQEK